MTDNEGFFNAATDSTTRTSGSSSAYDFVKGFITGQVALLSLLVFIVRFLFFRSTGSAASGGSLIRIDALAFSGRKGRKSDGRKSAGHVNSRDSDSVLLERLFGLNHQALKQRAAGLNSTEILVSDESARWLTFLLAKTLVDPLRSQLAQDSTLVATLLQERAARWLSNGKASQQSLDGIILRRLTTGTPYPSIESYQLVYDAEHEACAFRMRCSWQDVFTVEMESALRIVGFLALPFSLSVQLRSLRFTAQLHVASDGQSAELTCLPDDHFLVDLEVGSLVGHRTKLKDLPKITSAVVETVRRILSDTIIHPQSVTVPLPKLDELLHLLRLTKTHTFQRDDTELEQRPASKPTGWCEEALADGNEEALAGEREEALAGERKEAPAVLAEHVEHSKCALERERSFLIESMLSDESEPMHLFMDSRYDFDDEDETDNVQTEALVSVSTSK